MADAISANCPLISMASLGSERLVPNRVPKSTRLRSLVPYEGEGRNATSAFPILRRGRAWSTSVARSLC